MGEDNRGTLLATAQKYQEDIAVADYLMYKYSGVDNVSDISVATPGMLINWVLRFDVPVLDARISALKGLIDAYNDLAEPGKFQPIKDEWAGEGGQAFENRWEGLRQHVNTRENDINLVGFLNRQKKDMLKLTENAGKLQKRCEGAIESRLAGLRKKYIKALVEEGDGGDQAILDKMSSYGGTGAGIGAIGGPKGVAIGGALGMVLGAILGFVQQSEGDARELLIIGKDGKDFTASMTELSHGLSVMDRARYSADDDRPDDPGYGETEYRPEDLSMADDAALNGGWAPER